MVSKVELLGNKAEAEKLRGFALSQLRILLDSMQFQGLKQYTRVVRFCDGSYVRAFSSFGLDTVTIFAPPISVPEREIIEVEEAVYVPAEPTYVGFEVPDPVISTTCEWVQYCSPYCDLVAGTPCACPAGDTPDSEEYIVGNEKWIVEYSNLSCKSAEGGAYWGDHTQPWNPCNCPDPPCGNPWECRKGDGPCYFVGTKLYYYKWEC